MGFCSFCGSESNESDDGPEFPHSLGGKRSMRLDWESGHILKILNLEHQTLG